jgi:two-component sensor histidine kinase/CheY-like chemotaxis protein
LVQSIVRLSRSDSVTAYITAVEGRIGALSRAHTLLAQSRWQGTDLARLVDEELAPYRTADPQRIVAKGPEVLLEPGTAQTLALALHELSTNAAKYGALSQTSGRLVVNWDLRPDKLLLSWTERGGPELHPPKSSGFGVRVIRASIERQLEGEARFEWPPEGLECNLSVPRGEKIGVPTHRVDRRRNGGDPGHSPSFQLSPGNRILVVEDEILLAMMMHDILIEFGFVVVGPFNRLSEAMVAAALQEIDAGIIDVNLAGQMAYPVADVLAGRRLPFVFVTGYGSESIESRFAGVPVIGKPVRRDVLESIFSPAGTNSSIRHLDIGRSGKGHFAPQSAVGHPTNGDQRRQS